MPIPIRLPNRIPLRCCMLMLSALCVSAQAQDLNTASEADLDAIRGSGPALTFRILAARRERPFAGWDDVQARVKGIGPATVARWSTQGVTVRPQVLNQGPQIGVSPEPARQGLPHNR